MADSIEFKTRPKSNPMIYAYEEPSNPAVKGMLKIGFTSVDVEKRVAEQFPIVKPGGKPYKIVFRASAMYNDGSTFTDHDIHKYMRKHGYKNPDGEWFVCTIKQLESAYIAVKTRTENDENRCNDFDMRPEQKEAVNKTIEYYSSCKKECPDKSPKFLWNAKMRFGKTFTAYQLAKKMGFKKILVLTFKPAVQNAWYEDLMSHVDFKGWQFICRGGMTYEQADHSKPIVCFGSFQDYLGTNENGGIKAKNEWVHTTNWDIVIFDEYHFGAWRDNAKKLFEQEDEDNYDSLDFEQYKKEEADNAYNETFLPITTSYYLFLSGTPFRAINSGEFIEDQIYNWTYADEQNAKENWDDTSANPYLALPKMILMTYKIPESIRRIARQGEFDEFDLNIFFSAKGEGENAKFVYEDYVQKWLDLIRGAYLPTTVDDLKLGNKTPPMPYSDVSLLNVLTHTFWFMPNVSSCFAMKNLLMKKQNIFYHSYKINVCAGVSAGIGADALKPVLDSMEEPLQSKSITLSCGKLTTGVTVKPWTGIFMLRNLKSPETYFQAAFRVQSPWVTDGDNGTKIIQKQQCYVFDFALDRALKEISDYSRNLNIKETNPEKKVEEFISFLPVLAYDGSSMRQINATEILDIAMAGTSATLLAKRWESALLVNVDNQTLARLMANEEAMNALMKIEGFRSLNSDIETIINKSEAIKKAKKEGTDKLTSKQKKQITEEEKEYKSKRKEIQEKLIKFGTRIPIFMYLTDYREHSLEDVIRKLEPGLFKKVTGLNVRDFDLLVSLGVFNKELMNDAIYKFKRYEDSSLSYTGIDKHEGENVGLWDTVISNYDYMVTLQQKSMDYSFSENSLIDIKKATQSLKNSIEQNNRTIKAPQEIHTKLNNQKATSLPAFTSKHINEKKYKQKFDLSSLKIGKTITHNKFGEGEVIEISSDSITLSFGKAEKKFLIPQAFENGFLKL